MSSINKLIKWSIIVTRFCNNLYQNLNKIIKLSSYKCCRSNPTKRRAVKLKNWTHLHSSLINKASSFWFHTPFKSSRKSKSKFKSQSNNLSTAAMHGPKWICKSISQVITLIFRSSKAYSRRWTRRITTRCRWWTNRRIFSSGAAIN